MAPPPKVKVLERTRISPPPGLAAAAEVSLPLTYFDLLFLRFHPVQRLFLYDFPHSTTHFLGSHLPNLKHSLSLALQLFYPLAGKLISSDGSKPDIRYVAGNSVSLIVAECNDDFIELSGNHARDATRFHSLLPPLPKESAVLALQVTLFPNSGIGIGISIHHAVADGSTSTQFMKSWASFCRLGKKAVSFVGALPFYDRSVIKDPKGLERIYLNDMEALKEDRRMDAWDLNAGANNNVFRATFVFSRDRLNRLGQWVLSKTLAECSPFALACGFIWVCLVKARGDTGKKIEHFGFVSGCRARLDPPISPSYFGNCLGICRVEAKRSDLVGEDGVAAAAEAIWKVIQGLGEGGVFEGAESWVRDIFYCASEGALTVAGSPKLGVYKTDFGWGRPRKVEVISTERTSALSLAESRDEQGGIEVGLALSKDEIDGFASQFAKTLNIFS